MNRSRAFQHLWADAGYRGADYLREWSTGRLGLFLEIVQCKSRWVWALKDGSPNPYPRTSR
jgi:hypothetical protein